MENRFLYAHLLVNQKNEDDILLGVSLLEGMSSLVC
jgi:hypothetical protein